MTIISLKKQLTQFLNTNFLNKTAKNTQLSKRIRSIKPFELVTSLISSLSKGNCSSIADFHRQFNGMELSSNDFVAYKPFHNQLRKPEFASFMKQLVEYAIAQLIKKQAGSLPKRLNQFSEVILQDGRSFWCVPKPI